jgi:hypothetical protein
MGNLIRLPGAYVPLPKNIYFKLKEIKKIHKILHVLPHNLCTSVKFSRKTDIF